MNLPFYGKLKSLAVIFLMLGCTYSFTSCVSSKTVTYFQEDINHATAGTKVNTFRPVIEKGDLLNIVVGSLSLEANEIFNARSMANLNQVNYSGVGMANRAQPVGYLVDLDGTVEVPMVGKVEVDQLTTSEASSKIKKLLDKYLKEASVVVRVANFKVSVLGEVKNPATFVIPEDKITVLEAITLAGDLTIYGRRSTVMVIREENDQRFYGRVDLTSRNIFESPYYYLRKNDIVYIEPTKAKVTSSDQILQILPLVLSSLSVIAVVLTRFL